MKFARELSRQIAGVRQRTVWVARALLVACMAYAFFLVIPAISAEVQQPGFKIVDAIIVRWPTETFQILENMGSRGRILYLRIAAVDVLIPICYALALGSSLARVWRLNPKAQHRGIPMLSSCIHLQPIIVKGCFVSLLWGSKIHACQRRFV